MSPRTVLPIIFFVALWSISDPAPASAGIILNAPIYIGLNDALLAYWSFDGSALAGTNPITAYDHSGNNHHASSTLDDSPEPAVGRIGQALDISFTPLYAGNPTLLNDMGARTVSVWINPTAIQGSEDMVVGKTAAGSTGWSIEWDALATDGLGFIHSRATTDLKRIASDGTFTVGAWQHLVVTWDGSTNASNVHIYKNGVEVSYQTTQNGSGALDSDAPYNFTIGAPTGSADDFAGKVDELRIYDGVISQEEIRRLYKIGATFTVSATPRNQIKNGLVGYWTFDGQDFATDSAGAISAYDRSGQNNHASSTASASAPSIAPGRLGQGIDLDGSNDFLRFGSASTLDDISPISISAWINPDNVTAESRIIVAKGNSLITTGWNFGMSSNGPGRLTFFANFTSDIQRDSVSDTLKSGEWQHIVLTWSGTATETDPRMYVNGLEVSYVAGGGGSGSRVSDAADNGTLGATVGNIGPFPGLVDDVRLYNRILSADEIKRLYKMGGTFTIGVTRTDRVTDGLVGYWTFDGPSLGTTSVTDVTGNGSIGYRYGAATPYPGKIGQGMKFDGVDGGINMNTPATLNTLPAISTSAWIYYTGPSATAIRIVGKAHPTTDSGWHFQITNTSFRLRFEVDNDDTTSVFRTSANQSIKQFQWHHLAATWPGSNSSTSIRIYIDGVETPSYAVGGDATGNRLSDSTTNFVIGEASNGIQPWYGIIDDVRVYNRELSAEEVRLLYNMGR